MINVVAKDGCS